MSIVGLAAPALAGSPLESAKTVWHFSDASDSAGSLGPLAVEGDVAFGEALAGDEREASVRRGGDGRVAQFRGGFLRAANPAGRPFAIEGQEMTLLVRLQDPNGVLGNAIFSRDAADSPYCTVLAVEDGQLTYRWQTEPLERRLRTPVERPADSDVAGRERFFGVLRLRAPLSLIGPTAWHDVVARFRGPNLELFVDGVLMDEEWPHGDLYRFAAPFLIGAGYENGQLRTGFRGAIDHIALWDRALQDDEITILSGGADEVARRDREMLGPIPTTAQYWKPHGYNAWAGDCMPFFHDGTFHLFYLFDRHHHNSKWGQGAHQYAHLTTTDLVHWQQQPLAVPIVRQWECSMGTCDCIWHDGVYYLFYTDCGDRAEYRDKPQQGPWIFVATSTDGIHFQKDLKPIVPGGDCTVFRDPATGLFHMIRGGANRLVSKDLRTWEEIPGNFVERKTGTTGECPHLFAWNGWYYFILGTNAIWKSRTALGPWEEMAPTIYDGLFVPKVAEFTGDRRILAGFIFERGWAGHLALRELVQHQDGSLGTKFAPEMIPPSGEPLQLAFTPLGPNASGDGQRLMIKAGMIKAGRQFATAALEGVPQNVRITLRVVPGPGVESLGLCLRGKGDYEGGCELRFDPSRRRAQYGSPRDHGPADDATGPIAQGRDFAINKVDRLDQPFTLDIIVKNDLIDACIDGRRTMITRRDPEPKGDRLFFFVRDGEAAFESIEIRPLQPLGGS